MRITVRIVPFWDSKMENFLSMGMEMEDKFSHKRFGDGDSILRAEYQSPQTLLKKHL
jgi:hypothetical protein